MEKDRPKEKHESVKMIISRTVVGIGAMAILGAGIDSGRPENFKRDSTLALSGVIACAAGAGGIIFSEKEEKRKNNQ